jgi:hypothetical protein
LANLEKVPDGAFGFVVDLALARKGRSVAVMSCEMLKMLSVPFEQRQDKANRSGSGTRPDYET